jgi:uncharacterized RDD family membrane protein YckC
MPDAATFCPACGTPVQTGSSTATPAGTSATMSGFDALTKDSNAQMYWVKRFIAIIVDYVIIGIVVWAIVFAALSSFFFAGGYGAMAFVFGGFTIVVGVILILYFPLSEVMWGATIGKRVLGLKVVSKNGTNPTFVEAFVRNVSKIYWLLLLLDVIVGLAVSKGYQQKYTDKMMGTSVVLVGAPKI